MGAEYIHVDDESALAAEFSSVKKPRNISQELLSGPLEAIEERVLYGAKVGLGKRLAQFVGDKAGFRVAVWRWLRPEYPRPAQDHLVDLQRKVGLGHIEHRAFCAQLVDQCREFCRSRPRLSRYAEGRIAEIEYKLSVPMPGDANVSRGFERLQGC